MNLWGQRSQKKKRFGRGQKNTMRISFCSCYTERLAPPTNNKKRNWTDHPKSISLSVLVQITKLYSKYFKSEQNSHKVIKALRQKRIRILRLLPLKKQKRILRFISSSCALKQTVALSSGKAKTL